MPLAAPSRLPPPADLTTLPDATDGDEAIVDPEVIDLTCDERLISERGLILATGGDVGAAEDVYPFSVDGGRRLNEKRIELQPYVTNGQLFR